MRPNSGCHWPGLIGQTLTNFLPKCLPALVPLSRMMSNIRKNGTTALHLGQTHQFDSFDVGRAQKLGGTTHKLRIIILRPGYQRHRQLEIAQLI